MDNKKFLIVLSSSLTIHY